MLKIFSPISPKTFVFINFASKLQREMNHLFDLNSLNDYTSFHDALANLAINSPEDLRNLLVDLPRVYLYNHSKNPYTHLYRRRGLMGMDGIEAISDDEAIERIVEESATRRPKANPKEQEHSSPFVLHRVSDVELAMYVLYENNAAEAIKFLVDHALPEVRTAFLNKFLPVFTAIQNLHDLICYSL